MFLSNYSHFPSDIRETKVLTKKYSPFTASIEPENQWAIFENNQYQINTQDGRQTEGWTDGKREIYKMKNKTSI